MNGDNNVANKKGCDYNSSFARIFCAPLVTILPEDSFFCNKKIGTSPCKICMYNLAVPTSNVKPLSICQLFQRL